MIEAQLFGELPGGEKVLEYSIRNVHNLELKVITYGGTIRSLSVPDKNGIFEDVILGFDDLDGYLGQHPYFGAVIGRFANRIANGRFKLDSQEYVLATNNNGNHLHGGLKGFDKVNWQAEPFENDHFNGIRLQYLSKDLEEGFPGNLQVEVTYGLTNDNELTIDYQAATDKKTILNLTNHAYYNLSGSRSDILQHKLKLNASKYLAVDKTLIPTEAVEVAGTPFDFTNYKAIGLEINQPDEQLALGAGYDHCFVINQEKEGLNLAASLYDPDSGRQMEVYTDQPGVQLYTGNFIDGTPPGKAGNLYKNRSGLCLETQHFPNSPNRPDFPSTIVNPGQIFRSRTLTKFLIRK